MTIVSRILIKTSLIAVRSDETCELAAREVSRADEVPAHLSAMVAQTGRMSALHLRLGTQRNGAGLSTFLFFEQRKTSIYSWRSVLWIG